MILSGFYLAKFGRPTEKNALPPERLRTDNYWRISEAEELLTILAGPGASWPRHSHVCDRSSPGSCIHPEFPGGAVTEPNYYLTNTLRVDQLANEQVLKANFYDGQVILSGTTYNGQVRAVRTGSCIE